MRRHICKYCKTRTHCVDICPNCREKIEVWNRIQKLFND